ncbi:MAG: hypothetical protein ACI8ZN_000226 [Bacteroidia bacterium]|jgi:hypothetical protein
MKRSLISFLTLCFLGFHSCKPSYNNYQNIESNTVLKPGLYICITQKTCVGCLPKLQFLKEMVSKNGKLQPRLIIESDSNQSQQVLEERVADIEQLLGFEFNNIHIDKVRYEGLFKASCGFLCDKGIQYSPSIIVKGNKESVLRFQEIYANDQFDSTKIVSAIKTVLNY